MYLFENNEMKRDYDNAFNSDDNNSFVVFIKRFSKGFFVGSNLGELAMWVRSEENNATSGKESYDFIRRVTPAATKNIRVVGMTLNVIEDTLAVALENNNIGLVSIKSLGLNDDITKEVKFELVCKGFHSGAITSIDVAVQRPILVTCSRDDSKVRLWNYLTGQCEIAREYYVLEDNALKAQARPLTSAAIHPSGYQLAVSFIDKIWIHHVLHDELRQYKSLDIKNASLIRYSRGGQYFFAVERLWIHCFNAYTLELVSKFKHNGTKALDMVFAEHDRAVALFANDGYIGKWKMPGFNLIAATEETEMGAVRAIDFVKPNKGEKVKEDEDYSLVVAGKTKDKRQQYKILGRENRILKFQDYKLEDGELTQAIYVR